MLKEFIESKEDARRALLGTILADGHIAQIKGKSYHTKTYVEIIHTSKNLDLLKAVSELFEYLGYTCNIKEHNKVTKDKTYTLFRMCTNSTEELITLRDQLYDNKVKVLPKQIVDMFTPLSLLLLYLDDGTIKVRYKEGTSIIREARVTFCLDSFTLDELYYFMNYLEKTYSIKSHIYRHSKNLPINRGFRVWLNTENTQKFMEVIDKYYNAIPSMQYKFLKYYSL